MASKTLQNTVLAFSVVAALFFTHQTIVNLSLLKNTVSPEIYLIRIALSLGGFLFCILGGWYSYSIIGGALFAVFASTMVLFAEPFGPCSSTSRLGRPSRAKFVRWRMKASCTGSWPTRCSRVPRSPVVVSGAPRSRSKAFQRVRIPYGLATDSVPK